MKIIFSLFILLALGCVSLQMSSCMKDKVPLSALTTDCPDTISFQSTIYPMINANCNTSGCHDASSAGGYNLTAHAQISQNADRILQTIRHVSGVKSMPQGQAKLGDTVAIQLNCWILQGKLNN